MWKCTIGLALMLTAQVIDAKPAAAETITITPERSFYIGESPALQVSGLSPGETVRLHADATFERWSEDEEGIWRPRRLVLRSWADFLADASGQVDTGRQAPLAGTYDEIDPSGLFWSMRPPTDSLLTVADAIPPGTSDQTIARARRVIVTKAGKVLGEKIVTFEADPEIAFETVEQGRLNGVFAARKGARALPTLIVLHGSEGGSMEGARRMAARFASLGYAVFALNWMAWDTAKLKNVPNKHINQPVELIDKLRSWLIHRPEVAAGRIGLYGHSKGAEYATVAAVRYRWIRSVIACVPSDVVWEGYGIADQRNLPEPDYVAPEKPSSWSWRGKPLPYVPLELPEPGRWFDNTARYEEGRSDHPKQAKAARIPIERSNANFLLLGGDRDEIWASGKMARNLALQLVGAGKGDNVETYVYEKAGHMICGEGIVPAFLHVGDTEDPRVREPIAEGRAAVDAWARIKDFLDRTL